MALPVYQAAGAYAEADVGASISPAWPTHQANDVALLMVEHNWQSNVQLSVDAGFRPVPGFPRVGGSNPASNLTSCLELWWKRATGAAEGAPTITKITPDGTADHVRGRIVTFRGCGATGNPWNVLASGDSYKTQISTANIPGGTTTDAECLIVLIIGSPKDQTTPFASGWANADLANLVERFDDNSTIGHGSGLALATGEKAVAGAFGSTSVTVPIEHYAFGMLALTPVAKANDNRPYIMGIGVREELAAAGSITPDWPPHAANDIGVLCIESGGFPIATPAGWTEFPSSPQSDGVSGSTSTTSLHKFWKRAAGGAEASPSVAFVADHISGLIYTVRGCPTTGDPFDVTAGNIIGAASTAISFPAVTTTKENTLITHVLTHSNDANSRQLEYGGLSNAALRELFVRYDINDDVGGGTGFIIAHGKKDSIGATGNTTGTLGVSQRQARITTAWKAAGGGITFSIQKARVNVTAKNVRILRSRKFKVQKASVTVTGYNVALRIFRNIVFRVEKAAVVVRTYTITLRKRKGIWSQRDKREDTWTKRDPHNDA